MIREVFNLFDSNRDGTVSIEELKIALQALDSQLSKEELRELAKSIDVDGNGFIDFEEFKELMNFDSQSGAASLSTAKQGSRKQPLRKASRKADSVSKNVSTWCQTMRRGTQRIVASKHFSNAVIFCILLNTASMALEHDGQSQSLTATVEHINAVMAFCFLLEIVLRIVSEGPVQYFVDGYNALDCTIVILGVVEVFADGNRYAVLRAFRLLRLFKLARYLSTMQKQFQIMMRTLDSVATFLLLLFLFIFIFAIMGMHLFGGKLVVEDSNGVLDSPRHNFDAVFTSLVTVFQVLTTEGWNFVMYDSMDCTTDFAAIYYIVLLTLGTYILINLFVAIMVDGFATDPEAMARFKQAIKKTRAIIQNISSDVMHRAVGSVQGRAAAADVTADVIASPPHTPSKRTWSALRWATRAKNKWVFLAESMIIHTYLLYHWVLWRRALPEDTGLASGPANIVLSREGWRWHTSLVGSV